MWSTLAVLLITEQRPTIAGIFNIFFPTQTGAELPFFGLFLFGLHDNEIQLGSFMKNKSFHTNTDSR